MTLTELHEQTGFAVRTLQYIRAQEPGVLVTRVRGSKVEYRQPDCVINLRKRDVEKALEHAKPPAETGIAEAERRKAVADAELAEVKLAHLRRALVPIEDVRLETGRFAHDVRSTIDAFPGKHAHRVVNLPDLASATVALRGIARDVLASLREVPDEMGSDPEPTSEAA